MPGLMETIGILDELGIYHTGAGWKKEHIAPAIIRIEDKRIGFIAYVDKSTNPRTDKFSGTIYKLFRSWKSSGRLSNVKMSVDISNM